LKPHFHLVGVKTFNTEFYDQVFRTRGSGVHQSFLQQRPDEDEDHSGRDEDGHLDDKRIHHDHTRSVSGNPCKGLAKL